MKNLAGYSAASRAHVCAALGVNPAVSTGGRSVAEHYGGGKMVKAAENLHAILIVVVESWMCAL